MLLASMASGLKREARFEGAGGSGMGGVVVN